MEKNISILIPDGESSGVLKVLRCLSDCRNLDIYVLSSESNVASRYSRFIKKFYSSEQLKDPEKWIEEINKFDKRHDIDVILPTYLSGPRKLIGFRDKLDNPEKTLLPSSIEIFDLAIDKKKLAEHMELHAIPHPISWTSNSSNLSKAVR